MKKFAQLNSDNYVINVISVNDSDAPTEEAGQTFLSQTLKYKASQFILGDDTDLKKAPHTGSKWYPDEKYFRKDPLYPSWVFNEEQWTYNAPVAYPDDAQGGKYKWDEGSGSWIIDPDYSG